jgi:NAD(P)-dependent dehydrogenase (short-subunit alcohol dehydrogenase family)
MLDKLEHNFPPIDIVFNNAGIARPGSDPWDISSQNYLDHYTVIRRGFGRVVNISSTLQKSPADMAYACSKAALGQFVHDLAPSLDGTGVAISLVCPGHVRSDMGGQKAPHPVASVIPGAILGALLDTAAVNGHWIVAQDYAGLSLPEAIGRAKFYYRQEGL